VTTLELGLSGPVEREPCPFTFTGDGREYFRIWIVNLLLSVVTLGIYSAWAKVRRLQYFHRNTRVAGFGFDYHGPPAAILKGRLIALVWMLLYFGASLLGPLATFAAIGVLMLAMPWVVARSLRFRLHNTSYRGVRFQFSGSTRSAYWVYLGLPLVSVLTLFILVPFAQHQAKRYQYDNSALGRTPFAFKAPVGDFYVAIVVAGFLSFALFVAGMIGIAVVMIASGQTSPQDPNAELPAGFLPLFLIVYGIAILAGQALVTARLQNTIWEHTRLGGHRFVCRLKAWRLFVILLTNLALTLLTLGLYRPFAQVRLASYLAGAMTLVPAGSLDDFVVAEQGHVSAVGEEAADLFDFDIAF
jgi:uncharacterized membrane protein YjgN (DUF898 family)